MESTEGRLEGSTTRHAPGRRGGKGGREGREEGWEGRRKGKGRGRKGGRRNGDQSGKEGGKMGGRGRQEGGRMKEGKVSKLNSLRRLNYADQCYGVRMMLWKAV